jgi:predicted MFS family arabinose efflux permease
VRKSTLAVVLLTMVSFTNYVDRMVLSALAQPIKTEFSLSDSQVGLLTGFAFVLLYSFTSVPMARFADRSNRALVLSAALTLWSLATAACGLVKSFGGLLVARMFVGIGESGCQPIGYALISEYFPPHRRAAAIGWFLVGNSLGVTAGFAIGGWLGALYGWRVAFFAVGLPGVLLAIALAASLRASPRQADPGAQPKAALSTLQACKLLLADRRFRWLLATNGVYSFLIFGPIAWLPAFFMRSHGLELRYVGTWSGLTIGFGMATGMLIGGFASDRLLRRSPGLPQWFCAATAVATGIAYWIVLSAPDPTLAFVATFFASLIGALGGPTNAVTVQNVSAPHLRATAASLATLTISLIGIGLAPLVIGVLSDALTQSTGRDALRHAMSWTLPVCLITAACHARVARLMEGERHAANFAPTPES